MLIYDDTAASAIHDAAEEARRLGGTGYRTGSDRTTTPAQLLGPKILEPKNRQPTSVAPCAT